FTPGGQMNAGLADRLVSAFGLPTLVFEAPTKPSQFAMLDHFGPQVQLSNVRLDELLRVEIYRRGLHSDAFANADLRPASVGSAGTCRTASTSRTARQRWNGGLSWSGL